jgi:hypothetical protein
MINIGRSAARVSAAAYVLLAALSAGAEAPLDATAAEDLVRETYYEGLPLELAARIDASGAQRIASMLGDPTERAHHANILVALAECGQPGAYESIVAWTLLPRTGEVDRAAFRAWQALPHALGQLARHDARALETLESLLDAGPPAWHFRAFDSVRIARLTRRGAASGLANAGTPEAGVLLRGAEASLHADASFREHLQEARKRHRARAQEATR